MIIALVSTRIFAAVIHRGWTIKMPDGVPPTVVKSFEALIPSFVVVTIMFVLNWLVSLTSMGNLQDVIFTFLQTPLLSLGNTLGAMIIAYLFLHFFWFFGINGSMYPWDDAKVLLGASLSPCSVNVCCSGY